MQHIRSSVKGLFFLENAGIPTASITDFGETIPKGSLCVDINNQNLYIFRGGVWQLITTGSTASYVDISYIRPTATKTTIGGLTAGTIPNFATIQDVFDSMLYPFQAPTSSLNVSSLHEKGLTINKSMNYSITLNDGIVNNRQILLNNVVETILGSNSGTYNSPSNLTFSNSLNPSLLYYSHTYTFRATYNNSATQNSNILVEFAAPTYYGVLALANINQIGIKTRTKRIRKKADDINLIFNPTLQRFVYAYPAIYGLLTSIKDVNGFNVMPSFIQTTMVFQLADLTNETYNVYYSNSDTTQVNFINSFYF